MATFYEFNDFGAQPSLRDCFFYHTMDIPGIGLVKGDWDLHSNINDYLGPVNFMGKTVFDCGIASGFCAIEMERQGAMVIGIDRDEGRDERVGLIPYADYQDRFGLTIGQSIEHRKVNQQRLRNSLSLSRRAYGGKFRLKLGNIITDPIGETADIAFLGCILLHLSDPLAALYNVAHSVKETIIITETFDAGTLNLDDSPYMLFRPSLADKNPGTWWYMPPAFFKRTLEVVGFRHFQVTQITMHQEISDVAAPAYNFIARR